MKRMAAIHLLVLALLSVILVSGQNTNDELSVIYQNGMRAYESGDFSAYLDCFKQLDRMRPNHPTIMYNLAGAYSLNKMKDEAIRYLYKLILIHADPQIAEDDDFAYIRNTNAFKNILKRIDHIRTPVLNSQTTFMIEEKDLHPESIAFDDSTKTFYFGGIHKRKITFLDQHDDYHDFVSTAQDGLWAVSGIKIDSKNRRLWACSMGIPQMLHFKESDKGCSGIFQYNLDTQKLVKKYILQDEHHHGFGDLTIHPNGDVYTTDSSYPAIYRISKLTDTLEPYMTLDGFRSLQGLDFTPDGRRLFVADYVKGIYLVDLDNGKVITRVEHPDDVSCKGIDGLYFYVNSLIVIQNGINPMRVSRFFLSDDLKRITSYSILENNNPLFNEPTLGVIIENDFYFIANSQWGHYQDDGTIFPMEKLDDIHILKIILSD